MSAGDTIQCSDLHDAFEHMDELIAEGYEVSLEHGPNRTVLTITGTPETT